MKHKMFSKILSAILAVVLCFGMVPAAAIPASAADSVRILAIGNSYSRDTLYYLDDLAALVGKSVEYTYLDLDDATLRMHARNVAQSAEEYACYTSASVDTSTASSINAVVEGESWDIIMLQQNVEEAGISTTFTADLQFLLDYLADKCPDAEIYWNMTWANQEDTQNRRDDFDRLYDGNQNVMYNAIVDCLDRFIVGEGAEYGADFDGWFPVGAAIQNLRATSMGDTVTRDGYHLSLQAGRLTAAMTMLQVLFPDVALSAITADGVSAFLDTDKADLGTEFAQDPDYTNSEANLALIRQSVAAACADLTAAPALLEVPPVKTVENTTPDPDDVTVGQVTSPLTLHFGDRVVDTAGTVYATAYECTVHVPTRNTGDYTQDGKEGPGILKIWKSTDNGVTWDYADPLLTIDQRQYAEWGIVPDLYDRYELVKGGAEDYTYFFDGRDPNMGIMYYDMDGNGTEDEVLLYTFWGYQFKESGTAVSEGTYIMYSVDGGENWTVPQRITSQYCTGSGGLKRGDIASFSDGQILVPLYGTPKVVALLLQWNAETAAWETLSDVLVPNFVPEKQTSLNETSFIAPDPDGDVVHGFVRPNGQAVTSYDRGRTWQHVHTIDGDMQQPGWAYVDEERAFATWSFNVAGFRDTKGQMVYFDAGWAATQPTVVHENYYQGEHDGGDPSSKLLANGKILTIMYDSYFRAINGRFLDPNDPAFLLPELNDDAAEVTLKQVAGGTDVTLGDDLPFSHTLNTTATFTADGRLTVTAANGAVVEFAAGRYGIEADKATELRLAVTNGATYVKAWTVGAAEPKEWTAVEGGTATNSGTAVLTADGVELGTVTATRRATLTMDAGGAITAGEAVVAGTVNPVDMTDEIRWSVSNPAIATVDAAGEVTFLGAGTVTVTATLAGTSLSAIYTVEGTSAEVTRQGEKKVIFRDDFESFTVGENTFYTEMTDKGYVPSGVEPIEDVAYYNVVEEDGNKYLEFKTCNTNSTGFKVDQALTGDYTVQFDFWTKDGDPDRWMYINLWEENEDKVYTMVQMNGDHFRVQHKDSETGENTNSETFYSNEAGVWNTMKIARVNGGVYVKVWPQGTAEPGGWQYSVLEEEMDTTNTAKFRISIWSKLAEEHVMRFDNLLITQQQPTDRGTFGLQVVKTLTINGEKVDICRWVWTPLREL